VTQSVFFIKMTNWEYWPAWLVNLPTGIMWLWFALRTRSLFFFTTVNPVIETGGVMGESKINILNRIPDSVLPKTIFVERNKTSFSEVLTFVKNKKIDFPLIAKPDVGERGFMVSKVKTKKELKSYFEKSKVDFLIQEFIDYPLEISVMYHRFPQANHGKVTSLCVKKTLAVRGDGKSTIEELMANYPRAKLQLERFQKEFPELLKTIPELGKSVELEPIGNHSRGTTFLNGNHHIDGELEAVFDKIGFQMEDIFYGRFDMKCTSIADLKKGKNIAILEFNGIASEPAHIYDPSYSILKGYKDLWDHWKIIFAIAKIQQKKGLEPMPSKDFWKAFKAHQQYMKSANT